MGLGNIVQLRASDPNLQPRRYGDKSFGPPHQDHGAMIFLSRPPINPLQQL
jgi:hypothetical protein